VKNSFIFHNIEDKPCPYNVSVPCANSNYVEKYAHTFFLKDYDKINSATYKR
jgi:hypothetical protein